MKNYIKSKTAAATEFCCIIKTKYPEMERLITAILDDRLSIISDGDPDLIIEDSDSGISFSFRNNSRQYFLERPFSPQSFEKALLSILPTDADTGFSADAENCLAILGEHSVRLTPTEFRLFSAILENGEEFISAKDLSEKVWGKLDRNLCTVYVSYLRRKLDDTFGIGTLITASGKGYRLRNPHLTHDNITERI